MSTYEALNGTLDRLAFLPNIIRTRFQDVQRRENNGGTNAELVDRVKATVVRLEQVVAKLEKEVA